MQTLKLSAERPAVQLRIAIDSTLNAIEAWRAGPSWVASPMTMSLSTVADQARELLVRLGPQASCDAVLVVARFLLGHSWPREPGAAHPIADAFDALWLAALHPDVDTRRPTPAQRRIPMS